MSMDIGGALWVMVSGMGIGVCMSVSTLCSCVVRVVYGVSVASVLHVVAVSSWVYPCGK